MSADNFIEVDHDGKQFIVRHGFMSCEYGDGVNEVPIVGRFDTDDEVEEFINREYFIIEYGVDWTPAARVACAGGGEDLLIKIDSLEATLETTAKDCEAWMDEALMGRKTITALAQREQDLLLRINKAIFTLEDKDE